MLNVYKVDTKDVKQVPIEEINSTLFLSKS